MRLWHKELIKVLPDKMLLSQWRELSAIVGSINKNNTLNHRLVNILQTYPKSHLYTYTNLVYNEMNKRNFKTNIEVLNKIYCYIGEEKQEVDFNDLYITWHNDRYLRQCFYNLEEKFDRGIISKKEWDLIIKQINI